MPEENQHLESESSGKTEDPEQAPEPVPSGTRENPKQETVVFRYQIDSHKLVVKPEKWRLCAYGFFWTLAIFAILLTNLVVLKDGMVTPEANRATEQQGCDGFDFYESEAFNLDFGEAFPLNQSHLVRTFGFNNICIYWDYSPSREIMAMYFPFFEYSLVIYLLLDFVSTMLSYKRGELPRWYWKLMQVITPINIFLAAMFRMIFVCISYKATKQHAAAFLGLQIVLVIVAVTNALYCMLTRQSYKLGRLVINERGVHIFLGIYLTLTLLISMVKIFGTLAFVFSPKENTTGPDFYKIQVGDMKLGQIIDLLWLFFNGMLPVLLSYCRLKNEDPFTIYLKGSDGPAPDGAIPGESPTERVPLSGYC